MATITAQANGDWNTAGTWNGGVPGVGDDVVIDGAFTVQMDVSSAVLLSFTQTAGTLDGNDGTQWVLSVDGNVSMTGGTRTQVQLDQGGTANCAVSTGSGNLASYNVQADGAITLLGDVKCAKFTIADGASLTGSFFNIVLSPAANDFIACNNVTLGGTVGFNINIQNTKSNSGTIKAAWFVDVLSFGNQTFTQTGEVASGSVFIRGFSDGDVGTLVLGATSDLGAITLGGATTKGGKLDLNGQTVSASSIVVAGTGTNTLDIHGGLLDVDGDTDLAGIIVSDTSGPGDIECEGDFTLDATSTLPDGLTVTMNGALEPDISGIPSDNRADLVLDLAGIAFPVGEQFWDNITGTSGTFNITTSTINIEASGTFDGAGITILTGAPGGLPATIEGGTITNVDVGGKAHIDARGIGGAQTLDGGDNDNVRTSRGLVDGGVL